MRPRARAALALAYAALPLATACAPPRAPTNVLLVVVDTLRADRLGAYGHDRTTSPAIDRLAAEGVRYDRALSQAPWTTPSIGSLLTSRHPSALGIRSSRSPVPEEELLLSELLREHGYATGAVVSHSFCSARWGFAQGFDAFDQSHIGGHQATSSPGVTESALAFLDAHGDEPFFLWLHYFDPHFAYAQHSGFEFPRDAPYEGPIASRLPFMFLYNMRDRLSPSDVDEILRIYDSEIAFTDHHVGRVLDRLRERDLLDRTLVVFTADHGEEFLDHGGLGHTRQLHGELVNVPLIVRYPGGATGVVSEPVALLDVYPTVLDVLGLPVPAGVEGRSLPRPGEAPEPRTLFSETAREPKRAAVRGRFKLIESLETGDVELYDVVADPGETQDLASREPEVARRLRAELAGFARAQAGRRARERPVELSREDALRLEALGYVDEASRAAE